MGLLIALLQAIRGKVGIDLRCRKAAVTEKFLDAANLRTAIKKMSGKAMAQRMRAGLSRHAFATEILG